jgi:nucleotide-binding universal stress UspA family protein
MRLDTVVIGVDFSEPSIEAAQWTARVLAPGATLVLVHVLDGPRLPSYVADIGSAEAVSKDDAAAERRLEAVGASLDGGQVRTVVRHGRATDVLQAVVHETGADVLVVGKHNPRGRLIDALGSTAEKLLHVCTAPVLLARGLSDGVPRSILVPVDDSANSRHVLATAAALVRWFDAKATVLHVMSSNIPGRVRLVSASGATHALQDKLIASVKGWLGRMAAEAGFEESRMETMVVMGDARIEIPHVAETIGADFVVKGRHGAGAASQLLLGSVARLTLRRVECPVLVISERATG